MLVIRLIESSALLIPSKSRSLDLVLYPIALRKHPGSSGLSDRQEPVGKITLGLGRNSEENQLLHHNYSVLGDGDAPSTDLQIFGADLIRTAAPHVAQNA